MPAGQRQRLCQSGPHETTGPRETTGPVKLTLRQLRAHAVLHTFASGPTLRDVIERLEFVQADPIRAPARAQDLILRQRVDGYRAGDLERHYPALGIEEGYLYAYGFLTRPLWQLRHPPDRRGLSRREQRLLALVAERGEAHPDHLQEDFGGQRALNAWGGYSTPSRPSWAYAPKPSTKARQP